MNYLKKKTNYGNLLRYIKYFKRLSPDKRIKLLAYIDISKVILTYK